ncbi:MAG: hypothetical protein AAGK79_19820 [Pseudomonadota bacterium]
MSGFKLLEVSTLVPNANTDKAFAYLDRSFSLAEEIEDTAVRLAKIENRIRLLRGEPEQDIALVKVSAKCELERSFDKAMIAAGRLYGDRAAINALYLYSDEFCSERSK